MPKNRNRVPDRVDDPQIKPDRPQAEVKTPRSFTGSDFTHFPKLVIQMNAPRPRPQRPVREDHVAPPVNTAAQGEPQTSFARPLRGMGVGAYEGLRGQLSPQIESYRTAVHNAYADNTLTPEERTGLRQQRRGLRQDVRQYRNQHPLQMGLGARVKEMAQSDRTGGIGEAVKGMTEQRWPKAAPGGEHPVPSVQHLQELQERWKRGEISEQELLEALGFTGRLPQGGANG